MTKALLKKQMMEVFAWIYQDKKTGKNRSKKGLITFSLLYILVLGFLGSIFYIVADSLCVPLLNQNLGWLYFALMGIVSAALGVFASIFNTFTTLYKAKDNDLLLAMPIPVREVLLVRLSGVYILGLMYELLVMIPTLIVYFLNANVGFTGAVFSLIIPPVLSVLVLTLSCVLGWIVACISSRLKNQKILTVIVSLAFIGVYYYFCGNASTILQKILTDPDGLGEKIKGIIYPLYHMGLAAEGNAISMLIFSAIIFSIFGVVYLVLHLSFLKLATSNRGAAKVKYVEKKTNAVSPERALLYKEFRRFLGSHNYMLNCGLGIVFMILASVLMIIKRDVIKEVAFGMFAGYEDILAMVAAAAICLTTTMNDMSAPSVSLEGKNIWIAQSLPISGWQALSAKLKMHLILTLIPAAVMTACVEWLLKPNTLFAILIPLIVILFILLMAVLGLVCNLKMPNLSWTSEVVPIKQSACVMLVLFGGWGIILALCVVYYLLMRWITPAIFLTGVSFLLLILDFVLLGWLKKRGGLIFESL